MFKQEIISPKQNEEPLKLTYMFCGTLGYHGNPDEEYWARLYFSTHTEIHFDEHKSNYSFITVDLNINVF